MVSQSPSYYILLSSLISGIMLLISIVINNWFQLKREEKQHIWQIEREEQQRIWQEKNDQQKWYREKTYNSYKKLVEVLTKIQQIRFEELRKNDMISELKSTEIDNLYLEFESEYSIIIASHPDKDCEKFNKKEDTIFLNLKEKVWLIKEIIIEIMINDPRIIDIKK